MMRVYVEQFGSWWSMSLDTWHALVSRCVSGENYDLDKMEGVKRIRKAPKGIYKAETGEWFSTTNDLLFRQPLDWSKEDFLDEQGSLNI